MNPIATWWDWGDWWQLLVSGSDSKQVSTSIFGVPMGPRSLGRDRWDLGPWEKKPVRSTPSGGSTIIFILWYYVVDYVDYL